MSKRTNLSHRVAAESIVDKIRCESSEPYSSASVANEAEIKKAIMQTLAAEVFPYRAYMGTLLGALGPCDVVDGDCYSDIHVADMKDPKEDPGERCMIATIRAWYDEMEKRHHGGQSTRTFPTPKTQ